MFSFFKKRKQETNSAEDSNFKEITENLYRQSFELVVKNRTLSHLNELYEISVRNLVPKELAEHIASVIQSGLESEFVTIFLYNQKKDMLNACGSAYVDRAQNSITDIVSVKNKKKQFSIKSATKNQYLYKLIKNRESCEIEDTSTFLKQIHGIEFLSGNHAKLILMYPLLSEQNIIGALMIGFNRPIMELTEFEKESVKSFTNVVAVALDKALIYETLRVTNQKLEEVNRGQESLIHVMNHQIKGYLTIAKNVFSELSLSTFGDLPQEAQAVVEKGLISIEEGVQYIQTILHATSARDGTLQYNMEPVDVKKIVQVITEKQRSIAEKSGLQYEVHVIDGVYTTIGDAIQLGEVFKNLITNAIKYNTKNGSIIITLTSSTTKIIFSIKDTGVGITDDDKDRLFTPGGMGKKSLMINSDASGYGLSFIKDVIKKHHGSVGFSSNAPEKGTTFFVTLPIKKEN